MARVALTGITGLLGGNLGVLLSRAGHRVRATRRSSSRADHLAGLGIEWAEADLDDPVALTEAFRGADVVFHVAAQVSQLPKPTPLLVASNVDGTRNVLEAVQRAGVPRLVYCSTVAAVGLSTDGKPCTEESPWNFPERKMDDGYAVTKRRAEELVHQAVARGLDAVICNPSYMLGPYDAKPSTGRMILDLVRHKIPGYTDGCNNFVDVRDVARGFILAWEKGKKGERYILAGENLSYEAAFTRIAAAAGARPPARRIPRMLGTAIGLLGDFQTLFTGREPLINSVTVKYGFCKDFAFSSAKAERELGYSSGPIEPAVTDAVAWFRGAGML